MFLSLLADIKKHYCDGGKQGWLSALKQNPNACVCFSFSFPLNAPQVHLTQAAPLNLS